MRLEDYEFLPDALNTQEVEQYTYALLDESSAEDVFTTLKKFSEVGDRQWHTYELPSTSLQHRIRQWLVNNWMSESQDYLEEALVICYCFALDKQLYTDALTRYMGSYREEFERNLSNSEGTHIDPWWSLRKPQQ